MSWGADAIQAIAQNRGNSSTAGSAGSGTGSSATSGIMSTFAPNTTEAAGTDKGFFSSDFLDAVRKDMANNNKNKVDLPQNIAQIPQLPSIQQFARQPITGQTSQFQQPPTITGYNL